MWLQAIQPLPSTCTPFFPNCTCATPATFSCDDYGTIQAAVADAFYAKYSVSTAAEMQVDPAGLSRAAGEFVGGTVRLVFHDAAEYDPATFASDGLRSDGCVNLGNPANNGLGGIIAELDRVWLPLCDRVSRADFWVIAANSMMVEGCPYTSTRHGPTTGAATSVTAFDANSGSRRRLGDAVGVADPTSTADVADAANAADAVNDADVVNAADAADAAERLRRQRMEARLPRGLLKGGALHDHVMFGFRFGRIDNPSCGYSVASPAGSDIRLPSAERGVGEITRALQTRMGLDDAEAVALIGAHTLGAASVQRSGYDSYWKDRPDLFDITYYKVLLVNAWTRNNTLIDPVTGAKLQQWSIHKGAAGGRNPNAFMTNSDMQLIYNVDASTPSLNQATQCNSYCSSVDPGRVTVLPPGKGASACPYLTANAALPNYTKWALLYAEGNTTTQDEPGASRWMNAFVHAFQTMTELGYADESLSCPPCVPSFCPQCTLQEACHGQTDWSLTTNAATGGSGGSGGNGGNGGGPGALSATTTPTPSRTVSPTPTPSLTRGASASRTSVSSVSPQPPPQPVLGAFVITNVLPSALAGASARNALAASIAGAIVRQAGVSASTTVASVVRVTDLSTGAVLYSSSGLTGRRRRLAAFSTDSVRVDFAVNLGSGETAAGIASVKSSVDPTNSASLSFTTAVVAGAQASADLSASFSSASVSVVSSTLASSTPGPGASATTVPLGAIVGSAVGATAVLILAAVWVLMMRGHAKCAPASGSAAAEGAIAQPSTAGPLVIRKVRAEAESEPPTTRTA